MLTQWCCLLPTLLASQLVLLCKHARRLKTVAPTAATLGILAGMDRGSDIVNGIVLVLVTVCATCISVVQSTLLNYC